MQTKKTNKADLENKKGLFLQAGFIIALSLTFIAFEWGTRNMTAHYTLGSHIDDYETMLLPPSTDYLKPKVAPPPPPVTEFEIVDEIDENLINDIFIWDVEENPWDKPFDLFGEEEETTEAVPFFSVQQTPSFNGGGLEKFQAYLYEQLRYPEAARRNGISGKVIAQFVVNEEGKIESVQILRSIDDSLSGEVIRVLTGSPAWTPGEQRGRKVKVQYSIPVFFTLND